MVRKLILATAGSLVFCSTAFGLGLGDLQLRSNLNQTFNGTIEVRDLDGLGQEEVLVRLASPEEFARAGIDRGSYLQDFRFSVQVSGGRGQIRVSSSRPVTEPFVEFLVNVVWPNGKLQRQYTALLDPPDNEVLRPSAMAPATSGPRPRRPSPNSRDEREDAVDAPRRPEAAERAPTYDRSEYGPTSRNDTLWKVASQVRPSRSVTVRQTMLALLRLNPDAFINNNINLLKAGRTLKVPSTEQVRQTSDKEARNEVARQTREWRGVNEQPEVADTGTPVTNTPQDVPPPPRALPRDEVRIVTPPAPGEALPTPAPETELAGSKEERDRLARELGQAGTSITALQEQNQALNNKISARDQEMAELSRKLAELEAAGPAAPDGKSSAGLFSTVVGKALLAALGLLLVGALVLLNLWNKARLRAQQAEREKAATDERLERTVRMERERTGNTQRGGIPLTTSAATVAAASVSSQRPARPPAIEPSLDLTSDGLSQTAELTNFDKTVILADPGAESRRVTQEMPANDVVSEADIYIAYGRFPQAISFLQSALEKEPNRNDARLKLMEAYAETKDAAAFQLEAQQLLSRSPSESDLRRGRQLQARLPGVNAIPSQQLAEQSVDFDKTIIDTSMADQELQETLSSAAVELDLDLDRTELLSDIEGQKPLDLDLSADAIGGNNDSLDFDLNLDAFDEPAAGDRSDQLGGDLGLEFRDDDSFDPGRTARSDGKGADDGLGLDLTLDGRTRRAEPTRREQPVQPDDDQGLSLTLDSDDDVRPVSRPSNLMNLDTVAGSPVDDDLADFLSDDTDEARTKLDLARAYIDMGDEDGARDILNEVLAEGSDGQKHEARELIARLS